MVSQVTPIPDPPTPSDSPSEFDRKAYAAWAGLKMSIPEMNILGGEIQVLADSASESATSAQGHAASAYSNAQSSGVSEANARGYSETAASASTSSIAAKDKAIEAKDIAVAASENMREAIALAETFDSKPSTFLGWMIVVRLPHFRFMIWDGGKYIRAPWNMPGVLFYSHAPAENITQGIQVRSDVIYNTADHPDLAGILGMTGSTFTLPDGRARVLRSADNGRGVDVSLVNGVLQEDAIRNITGGVGTVVFNNQLYVNGAFGGLEPLVNTVQLTASGPNAVRPFDFDASRVVPTAAENRVKSLVATLYITR